MLHEEPLHTSLYSIWRSPPAQPSSSQGNNPATTQHPQLYLYSYSNRNCIRPRLCNFYWWFCFCNCTSSHIRCTGEFTFMKKSSVWQLESSNNINNNCEHWHNNTRGRLVISWETESGDKVVWGSGTTSTVNTAMCCAKMWCLFGGGSDFFFTHVVLMDCHIYVYILRDFLNVVGFKLEWQLMI